MSEPLALELRDRVVRAYEAGEGGYITIALRYKVAVSSVRRWVAQYRRLGHLRPQRKRGGQVSTILLEEIEAIVTRLGDATVREITVEYNRHRRGAARRHDSSIKRALHRAGFVVKKNDSGRWSNSAQTS